VIFKNYYPVGIRNINPPIKLLQRKEIDDVKA